MSNIDTTSLSDGGHLLLQSSLSQSTIRIDSSLAFTPLPSSTKPTISTFFTLILFYSTLIILYNQLLTNYGMPAIVTGIQNITFSGERAWNHVQNITLNPHMYNSYDNLRVQNYILEKLLSMQSSYDATNNSRLEIFPINQPNIPGSNVIIDNNYFEASNIVVRLKGSGKEGALLISAHYDSTPLSHGTTDDGIAISVMLETIQTLLYGSDLSRDIIFNFNNGEEMYLLGGYAFLRHPWFKSIRGFINLEGTGAAPGTRSILFRTNSFQMTSMLSSVPFPHLSVIFNDLMKFVKSDTDYRPYSNAGLPGIDIAFYSYRYLYHTPLDDIYHSLPISGQHMGDNLIALIKSASDSDFLTNAEPISDPKGSLPSPDFVFNDLYGLFFRIQSLFYYQMEMVLYLIVFALLEFAIYVTQKVHARSFFKSVLKSYGFVAAAASSSLLVVYLFSIFKSKINPASTYAHPIINIFWIGSLILLNYTVLLWGTNYYKQVFFSHSYNYSILNDSDVVLTEDIIEDHPNKADEALSLNHGLLSFWCTLLLGSLLLSLFGWKATFFISDWTRASFISLLMSYAARYVIASGITTNRISIKSLWLIDLIFSSSIPSLMTFDIFVEFLFGFPSLISEGVSSVTIDMAFAAIFIILSLNILPAFNNVRKDIIGMMLFLVLIPAFMISVGNFSFSSDKPQKLTFTHTWEMGNNYSNISLILSPTISEPNFNVLASKWSSALVNSKCRPHADKRDSTECIYIADKPAFDEASTKLIKIQLEPISKNKTQLLGNFVGTQGSRICTLDINFEDPNVKIDVWLDMDNKLFHTWETYDGAPHNISKPTSRLNSSETIYLMRRNFDLDLKDQITTSFLIRGSIDKVNELIFTCYHSVLENTFKSQVYHDLNSKKPQWLTFHHGKFGEIAIKKRIKVFK